MFIVLKEETHRLMCIYVYSYINFSNKYTFIIYYVYSVYTVFRSIHIHIDNT